jgi:hypothetical protein
LRIIRQREFERASQVDAFQIGRRNATQVFRGQAFPTDGLYSLDRVLHVLGIPRHQGVR